MVNRKVVKVFLASPGDLKEERLAAHEVADEINQNVANRLGYQIDLVGWEETVSSHGRPQSIINRELDQCELFYGMLWKRWGTPPDKNGTYTSGFEEEFRRSQDRLQKTGHPAIKLAFKKVDPEFLRDVGPDLKRVVQFREELITGQEQLFEEFANSIEFQGKFRRALTQYIMDLAEGESSEPEKAPTIDGSSGKSVSKEIVATELLSPEGAAFLRTFVSKTEKTNDPNAVTPFEVARLRLLGLIANKHGNDEQSLGPHDANIIYRHVDRVEFGTKEKYGLLDSALAYIKHEIIPLWHWHQELGGSNDSPLPLCSLGGPADVREGAILAMTLIGQPLLYEPPLGRNEHLRAWFAESTETAIKVVALGYLARWGSTSDLSFVKNELDRGHYQTRSAATDALLGIILRDSRQDALVTLIELQPDSVNKNIIDEIFLVPSALQLDSLIQATSHRNATVRLAATRVLLNRKSLTIEIAERLLSDSSPDVRMEALGTMINAGRTFSDTEVRSILVKPGIRGLFSLGGPDPTEEENYKTHLERHLTKLPEDHLNKLIEKASPFNEAEYLARAESYYEKYGSSLKEAVEDEFITHVSELTKQIILTASEETANRFRLIEDYIRKDLTRKALSLIEKKKSATDLTLIRKILKKGFVGWSDSDAEYLSKFGEWLDISLIITHVKRSDQSSNSLLNFDMSHYSAAASAICKIAKKRARELLTMPLGDPLMLRVVLKIPDREFRNLDYNSLKPLLFSDSDSVRKAGILKIIKACSRSKVQDYFSKYLETNDPVYYNVIYWFDFGINAPRNCVSQSASSELARM